MHIIEPPKPDAILELEFHGSNSSGRLHIPGELSKMVIEEARTRASRRELGRVARDGAKRIQGSTAPLAEIHHEAGTYRATDACSPTPVR